MRELASSEASPRNDCDVADSMLTGMISPWDLLVGDRPRAPRPRLIHQSVHPPLIAPATPAGHRVVCV
jgi:hypothetical protein